MQKEAAVSRSGTEGCALRALAAARTHVRAQGCGPAGATPPGPKPPGPGRGGRSARGSRGLSRGCVPQRDLREPRSRDPLARPRPAGARRWTKARIESRASCRAGGFGLPPGPPLQDGPPPPHVGPEPAAHAHRARGRLPARRAPGTPRDPGASLRGRAREARTLRHPRGRPRAAGGGAGLRPQRAPGRQVAGRGGAAEAGARRTRGACALRPRPAPPARGDRPGRWLTRPRPSRKFGRPTWTRRSAPWRGRGRSSAGPRGSVRSAGGR